MQRVSQDLPTLKTSIASLLRNPRRASIPETHAQWIQHLMELYRLYKIDPTIVHYCTWWEVQGILMIDDAMRSSGAKTCPRCKQPTSSAFTCENCGMRLN